MKRTGKTKLAIAILAMTLVCALAMTACGNKNKPDAATILLDPAQITLEIGQSAEVGYSTNFDGKVAAEFDDAKLSVMVLEGAKKIHITPLALGSSDITVRAGDASAVCSVTVVPSSDETRFKVVVQSELNMTLGKTSPVTLSPKVTLDGEEIQNAVTYSIAPEGVVTVSESGVVTATAVGKAVITVTSKKDEYPDATATCAVRVLPDADMIFDRTEYILILNGDNEVTPEVEFIDKDEPVSDPQGVEFFSGNESVVTVDKQSGKITAAAVGKTVVTASWQGLDVSVPVEVYANVVEIDSVEGLKNMDPQNYHKLVSDLTVDFTQDPTQYNKFVTENINATLDGNRHTVSMNIVAGDASDVHSIHYPKIHFVKTVGEKGVIKNTRFEYVMRTVSNSQSGVLLTGTNDGVIKDCEIRFDVNFHWHYNELALLTGAGDGRVENVIVYADLKGGYNEAEPPTGGNASIDLYASNTARNVLLVTGSGFTVPEGAQNVVKIAGADEFADSGFMTADFYAGEEFSVWQADPSGLPVFFSTANFDTITVETLDNITAHKNEKVNFELAADIEITMTASESDVNTQIVSVIPVLYGIFDGKGHTITINANGTEGERSISQNLIETISETGVLKNAKIVYKCSWNVLFGTGLVTYNNGVMEDLEIKVEHFNRWTSNGVSYIAGGGTGSFRNSVVTTERSSNYGQPNHARFALFGKGSQVKISNVLAIDSPEVDESNRGLAEETDLTKNFVVIYSVNDFADSDFDTTPFDLGGADSYWKSGIKGIPSFTEAPQEVTINVASKEEIEAALTNAEYADKIINFNLTADIAYTGTGNHELIPELGGVFNGNGHKISITANVAAGSPSASSPRENFVGTMTASGIIENVLFEYNLTAAANAYHTNSLVYTNNGIIRNCDIRITYSTGWHDGGYFYAVVNDGNGSLENLVVNVNVAGMPDASKLTVDGAGKNTMKNVLIITNAEPNIPQTAQNVVKIVRVADFTSERFVTSSFTESVWKKDINGMPSFEVNKKVEVSSIEDITAAISEDPDAAIDFVLNADITIPSINSDGNQTSVIDTLRGTFYGNGHTVSMSVTHTANNAGIWANFVKDIAPTGVIKDVKFVYSFDQNNMNLGNGSFISNKNDGLITDCELDISFVNSYWPEGIVGCASHSGSGACDNLVIRFVMQGPYQISNRKLGLITAIGNIRTTDVLIVLAERRENDVALKAGEFISGSVDNNIVACVADGYVESGFDTSSFSSTLWDLTKIPSLKLK